MVASNTRGPGSESSHRQLILNIYLLLPVYIKDEDKEKEAGMSILRKDPLPPMAIEISSFSSKSSGLFSSFGKDVVLLLTFAVYCLVKGYQLGDFKRINQQLVA